MLLTINFFVLTLSFFSENDINYDKIRIKRNSPVDDSHPGCGLNGAVSEWMKRIQRSAMPTSSNDEPPSSRKTRRDAPTPTKKLYDDDGIDAPWRKYSEEAQMRTGRALPVVDHTSGLYTVRTCTLYMQADQKLWEYIFNHEGQRSNQRLENIYV